jgi:hypothetical protein
MGAAGSLRSTFDVPPWQPWSAIKLSQLAQADGVDFSGLLVWAGEVNTGALVGPRQHCCSSVSCADMCAL